MLSIIDFVLLLPVGIHHQFTESKLPSLSPSLKILEDLKYSRSMTVSNEVLLYTAYCNQMTTKLLTLGLTLAMTNMMLPSLFAEVEAIKAILRLIPVATYLIEFGMGINK